MGWEGALLCFFPCTAFPTKVVKLHLVAKNRLIIHPGENLWSGPRVYHFSCIYFILGGWKRLNWSAVKSKGYGSCSEADPSKWSCRTTAPYLLAYGQLSSATVNSIPTYETENICALPEINISQRLCAINTAFTPGNLVFFVNKNHTALNTGSY